MGLLHPKMADFTNVETFSCLELCKPCHGLRFSVSNKDTTCYTLLKSRGQYIAICLIGLAYSTEWPVWTVQMTTMTLCTVCLSSDRQTFICLCCSWLMNEQLLQQRRVAMVTARYRGRWRQSTCLLNSTLISSEWAEPLAVACYSDQASVPLLIRFARSYLWVSRPTVVHGWCTQPNSWLSYCIYTYSMPWSVQVSCCVHRG